MKKNIKLNPLCEAVTRNDMESFDTLLESGVDLEDTDYNNFTALMYAAYRGRLEMAKKLLERGANIECRDSFGNTPLSRAIMLKDGTEMIKLLLSYGADVNAENNYGVSPKSLANTIAGFPKIKGLKD
ncbi:MAG: ankyrin repeat domain-containing protein [Bacteroidales bacterium]|nr:ankyrin repeat domain-containing protein [Bacteroidales bacterium]